MALHVTNVEQQPKQAHVRLSVPREISVALDQFEHRYTGGPAMRLTVHQHQKPFRVARQHLSGLRRDGV